ncbi:hypothetical protein BpHYR1_006179 [Brachionus plicatilis]|uniref:Uncharacterized protein n=1 Tax=Brachionus plicatilis TaxID=10195 RepID=A0A3M7PY40_BRAPC|nr:hypothetical protein BpHYR1_006179 [Brachionus plicatilis]
MREEKKISKSKNLKKFSFKKRIFKKLSLIFFSSLKNKKENFSCQHNFRTEYKNICGTYLTYWAQCKMHKFFFLIDHYMI